MIDPCQGSEGTGAQVPRWGLSAPESFVLLNGSSASGSEAFKLGLMELVAIGALILETTEHHVLFMERHVATLRDGPRAGAARPRALDAIFDLYARTPHQAVVDGLPALAVTELARAAASEYGSLGRYVTQAVLPSLAERGLYEPQPAKVLWIFRTTRWLITPTGEAARADLERWLADGEDCFPDWAANDPQRAMAFAAGAGAALLLMPALFPELRRLRMEWNQDGGLAATAVLYGSTAGADFLDVNTTTFDFSSIDMGALDSMDSAMSAIDSAVDAGSSDGGGTSDGGSGSDGGGGSGGD